MKEQRVKVKLAESKIKLTIKDLNDVLDEHRIFGTEWTIEVLQELIINNLTKDGALELIKRLEETPISKWDE